eukprot:scaffold6280_cov97-Isochrysis_galbana.AAC.3
MCVVCRMRVAACGPAMRWVAALRVLCARPSAWPTRCANDGHGYLLEDQGSSVKRPKKASAVKTK